MYLLDVLHLMKSHARNAFIFKSAAKSFHPIHELNCSFPVS